MTERQLDIWSEIIYEEIDKLKKLEDEIDTDKNPIKAGKIHGEQDGLINALVWLSVVEKGKRFKNRIAEIEKRLDLEDGKNEAN